MLRTVLSLSALGLALACAPASPGEDVFEGEDEDDLFDSTSIPVVQAEVDSSLAFRAVPTAIGLRVPERTDLVHSTGRVRVSLTAGQTVIATMRIPEAERAAMGSSSVGAVLVAYDQDRNYLGYNWHQDIAPMLDVRDAVLMIHADVDKDVFLFATLVSSNASSQSVAYVVDVMDLATEASVDLGGFRSSSAILEALRDEWIDGEVDSAFARNIFVEGADGHLELGEGWYDTSITPLAERNPLRATMLSINELRDVLFERIAEEGGGDPAQVGAALAEVWADLSDAIAH